MIIKYNSFDSKKVGFFEFLFIFAMVIFYPIFVSIYTVLPPLIGLVGYIIIKNVDKNRIYALGGMLYLINLDLNLTLPMLLSIFIVVMVYIFVYSQLKLLIRCHVCLLFTLILSIDLAYYMSLFIYDFVFNTSTIIGDGLLVFYVMIDIFIGMFL